MVTRLDPYLVLGVSTTSEDVVIRAAFKALMFKYHPDTNKSSGATTRAASINEAFSVLGDPLRREAYDASRNDIIIKPCSNPSASQFPSVQRTSLSTLDLGTRTVAEAAKRGWFAIGGSIIAALGVGAVMLMVIEETNGVFFSEMVMSTAYAVAKNNIEEATPLDKNAKDVMCNLNQDRDPTFNPYCSQNSINNDFYGTFVF